MKLPCHEGVEKEALNVGTGPFVVVLSVVRVAALVVFFRRAGKGARRALNFDVASLVDTWREKHVLGNISLRGISLTYRMVKLLLALYCRKAVGKKDREGT
jgi:hypothetical protein